MNMESAATISMSSRAITESFVLFNPADIVPSFVLVALYEKQRTVVLILRLFPSVANTPPEHCLSCLLSFSLPPYSTFALDPPRNGTNAPPEPDLITLRADAKHLSMKEGCQKTNIFIFGILLSWVRTFGAARSDM